MEFHFFKEQDPDDASDSEEEIVVEFPSDEPDILINYNKKFKDEQPTLFRDVVVDQSLSVLISKTKPNLLLVGQAGVGKTRIVEEIARLIASKSPRIPEILQEHTVYEIQLSSVIAGTSLHGAMEQKMQDLLAFLTDPMKKAVLFVDEAHQLCGERGNSSYTEIAQILKPALARGQIKMIGATTVQEAKNFLRDPAFSRRFNSVSVPELTQEQTWEICSHAAVGFSAHYNVKVPDELLSDIVAIADDKKKAGMHRPDNALTLLDRSMADALMDWNKKSELAKSDPDLQAYIQKTGTPTLTRKQLMETAHRLLSGNDAPTKIDQAALSEALKSIKGQDEAISYIKNVIARRELSVVPQTLPEDRLFFVNFGRFNLQACALSFCHFSFLPLIHIIIHDCERFKSIMSQTKKQVNTDYTELNSALKQNKVGNFYIFHGEERFLRDRYLSMLREHLLPEGIDSLNYRRYQGKDVTVELLSEAANTLPFLIVLPPHGIST